MTKTKEPNGNYLFLVPNDEEGAYFAHLCRKYAVNGVKFRKRGLQADRQKLVKEGKASRYSAQASVSLKNSDRIRIYASTDVDRGGRKEPTVFGPKDVERHWEANSKRWEMERKLKQLQAQAKRLAEAINVSIEE